jgi:hypothetical protein
MGDGEMSDNWPFIINVVANCATIVGVIGLLIAWRSYTNSTAISKKHEMNAMFREFLKLDYEYSVESCKSDNISKSEKKLRAYKMWVLEEVYIWLKDLRGKRIHYKLIDDWEKTIIFHLNSESHEKINLVIGNSWKYFDRHRKCYDDDFGDFVDNHHQHSPFKGKNILYRTRSVINCTVCGQSVPAD